MCLSEAPFPTAEDFAKIRYCPKHPAVNLGRYRFTLFGLQPEHVCSKCIRECIEAIPEQAAAHPEWYGNQSIDPQTVQIVLDVLDQKLGI